MIGYIGVRGSTGPQVLAVDEAARLSRALDPRRDLGDHAAQFDWGQVASGGGPAQLALALLADHLGDDQAARDLAEAFRWAVIAQLDPILWSLSRDQLDQAVERLRRWRVGLG